jgi:hypothetical protein
VRVIQIELMEAIHKQKSIAIPESQQFLQSKLIRMIIRKMHLIQFVLIVRVIQRKLIKVMKVSMRLSHFVLIVRVIQIELMEAIHNQKGIAIPESQQSLQSKLIRMMIRKMHSTQFVLIVRVIQRKLIKGMKIQMHRMQFFFSLHVREFKHSVVFTLSR